MPALPAAEKARLMNALDDANRKEERQAAAHSAAAPAYSSRVRASNAQLTRLSDSAGLTSHAAAADAPTPAIDSSALFRPTPAAVAAVSTTSVRGVSPTRRPLRSGHHASSSLTNPNKSPEKSFTPPAPHSSLSRYLPVNHPFRVSKLALATTAPGSSSTLLGTAAGAPGRRPGSGGLSESDLRAIQDVYTRLTSPHSGVFTTSAYCKKLTSRDIDNFIRDVGGARVALFHLQRLEKLSRSVELGAPVRRFKQLRDLKRWVTDCATADVNALITAADQRHQCDTMLALLTSPECVLLPQMEQARLGLADMELILHVSTSEHVTTEAVLSALLREGKQHDNFAALVAAALGVAKQMERDAQAHANQLQQSPYLSLQSGPTSQAILQQEALAALEHERREAEYAEAQARADALADAEQGRRDADAAARAAAEAARQAWLQDSSNFPPAALSSEPYTAEEESQLLSFLTHADTTLLSDETKMHLSPSSLRGLVDPQSHWSLDLMLVHLQHLNLTGREFADLGALKKAVELAENYKADEPLTTTTSAAGAASSSSSPDSVVGLGGYAIRRKIFLFLHKPTVEIYPSITWAETERLFVSSLAGPRLGSILYRLDQIGIAFPDFPSLLAHVSEIYARKSAAHSKNCSLLLEELSQLQSATFFEPRTEAEEINPRIERVPLLLEPLSPPSLGLVKRLMDLGLGLSNVTFLLQSFSRARFQFDEADRLIGELKRAYSRMQHAARRAQAFLQSTGVPGRIGTASGHVINGCVLASGPLPLKVLKETAAARAKRERLTLSGHAAGGIRRTAPTFLSNISLADAERLVRESDVLQWVPSPGVRALGHAAPDPDHITGLLVNLNNQVELQIKPAYTSLDAIIADVKALHTANWPKEDGGAAAEEGDDAAADDDATGGAEGELASEADARAREARRKARARKRAKLVAAIIHSTREWLLSSDCAVLRRKKDGFTISDSEVQSLLAAGGGSFESVKGHCRQLADQRIHVATVAELLVSVSYSHQLALEQQKEHRRIIFNCLRDAGLLDAAVFPPAAGASDVEYISDHSAALDNALNAILYFNTSGQHSTPKSNAARTNYFFAPLQTMLVLHFLIEVMADNKRNAAIAIRAGTGSAGGQSAGNAAEELKAQQESSAATRKPRPATAVRAPHVADADGDVVDHRDAEEAAAFLRQGSTVSPNESTPSGGAISPEEEKRVSEQVVALTSILHSIHTVYTAYLHAKKQVHAFFRSDKCELAVIAADSSPAAAATAAAGAAAGSTVSAPPVNLLKTCTLGDVESLFEGAQVGLHILPYLMELSFHGSNGGGGGAGGAAVSAAADAKSRKGHVATTSFPSWFALKTALAKLHQRKLRQRVERDANRRALAAFLASPDNKILRPGSLQPSASASLSKSTASLSASMDEALLTPLEWSDFDLDAVLECVGSSSSSGSGSVGVEGIMSHMRALSRDVVIAARIHTVAQLIGEIQTAERNQIKHEQAILAFLLSPQGCRLVLTPLSPSAVNRRVGEEAKSKEASRVGSRTGSRAGSRSNSPRGGAVSPLAAGGGRARATLADVKRLFVDGTAGGRTLPYLHQFASEKKSFHSWATLAEQVSLAHAAVLKQESKEKTVLAGFFEAQAGSLFVSNNGGKLSPAEIDSIHLEKGLSMPFSLLLLSLSALSASVGHAGVGGSGENGAFACLQDFRTKLHSNHVQLVNDYSNTLAVLSRPEICARLFEPSATGTKVTVTSAMILALFEQMEAQVSVAASLLSWQQSGRRFRDWNSMLLEFAALKVAADKIQVTIEAAIESRAAVQELLQQFELIEAQAIAEIDPRDLDSLLSLPLGANPIDSLHASFGSYQAQGLRFASFEHLVRVVQVELEKRAPQFEAEHAKQTKKNAAVMSGAAELPLAAGAQHYTISAPLTGEGDYGSSAFSDPDLPGGLNGDSSPSLLPSQRKNNKYTLFTPDGDAAATAAVGGPKSTAASERRNLQQQLNQLAEAQPWLDGCDEAGAEPTAEELIARRYQLFLALSYPASHLFVRRASPASPSSSGPGSASAPVSVHLNDDDLDEILLAAGVHSGGSGAVGGAVGLAITFARELDAEGRRFSSVESLVEAIGERAQRKELTAYLSTFGGLLAEMLHTPTVLASGFFDRLLAHMPSGGTTPDPMLPLSHFLARTQAFFETRQVAEREAALAAAGGRAKSLIDDGWRPRPVSEETFLATFAHLVIAARRGILGSLLSQGIPPFFESLFGPKLASNPSALKSQLTERMLEQMLALQGGSLYRTVRCLKDLEADDHRYASAQELLEAMAQQARTKRIAASMEGGVHDDQQQQQVASRGSDRKAAATAKFASSSKSASDDPASLQRRSALFLALSPPQCSLFSQRRDAISLTDRELDETLALGGGLAGCVQHIAAMDAAGVKLRSFDAFLVALSARRQFDLCAVYWTEAQSNAAKAATDPTAAATFAQSGQAYRHFTEDASSHSGALTQPLFDSMLQAMGGADPAVGVLAVLQSLQRIDGSTPVIAPLFPNQTELLQGLREESQLAKRHILPHRLFDPREGNRAETNLLSLLSFASAEAQRPEEKTAAAGSMTDASHPFCRWEGISSSDADSLLAACEGSLFFTLRHCGSLVRAGYSFSSVVELREAIASVHVFMREEEASQISGSAATQKQKHHNVKLDAAAALARRAMESRRRQSAGPRLPASSKLVFKDNGVSGLSSYDFTEDDEGDLDSQALSDEHRWRAEMDLADVASVRNGKPSTADAFRAALAESELFSELEAGAPLMSVGEVDHCVRAVRGSPAAFRVALLELERQHQRYTALAPFISDLRSLAAQREHDELLVALSYPSCRIFEKASAAGVEVDETQLRSLIRAASSGRSSLGAAKRMLLALDRAGVRFDSMDELIAGVKALRAERASAERAARQKEMERVQAAAKAAKAEIKQERKAAAAAAAAAATAAAAPAVDSSGAPLRSALKKTAAAPPPSEQDILRTPPSSAVHFDG